MISAVILAKNEERHICESLASVSFCGERLVIDDYSTDRTVEFAKKAGARVIKHSLAQNFASQRNFGLNEAHGEWVLFIDADEVVPPVLAKEIQQKVYSSHRYNGYYIYRRDNVWGKLLQHGEAGDIKLLRLGRKNVGVWKRRVHEYWDIQKAGTLRNALLHYPHQTVAEFLEHIMQYSTLHAQEKMEEGERAGMAKIIMFPAGKFFYNWILRGGFLDGTTGFLVAVFMSFHSFIAWSTLWLAQRAKND